MNYSGLSKEELALINTVFQNESGISEVILYGSRAKGSHTTASDIDLALVGIDDDLKAAAIAEQLDELPLPYTFDVRSLPSINHQPLKDHIARVGVRIYKRN